MGNKELSEGLECICRLRTSGKIVSENTGGDKPASEIQLQGEVARA